MNIQTAKQNKEIGVLYGQRRLIEDKEHKYLAAIGGVGSGKTTLGYSWHFLRCIENAESRYSLVVSLNGKYSKINFNGYVEYLESIGMQEGVHFKLNRSAPYSIKYFFGHEVLFWSAETKIVAVTTSHDWADESALFDQDRIWELEQRRRCSKAKLRQSLQTTTPEGYNHTYEFFASEDMQRQGRYSIGQNKLVLHSSSYDNHTLPEDFFKGLEERFAWDELYFRNYVMGEWVNLARNAFYFGASEDTIQEIDVNPEIRELILTFDNNVGKMQWVVLQNIGKIYAAVEAGKGTARNIQEACDEFEKSFPVAQWGNHYIKIAGDAVLHHRSEQTYTTGYELIEHILREKGYQRLNVIAERSNPLIVERSMSVNKMLKELRLVINPKCKRVVHSLRSTQSDGKGGIVKPSKDEVTHAMEAIDHAICVLEPVSIRGGSFGVSY